MSVFISCLQANKAMGGTHLVFQEAGNCCAAETLIVEGQAAEGMCSDPCIIAVASVIQCLLCVNACRSTSAAMIRGTRLAELMTSW